MSTIQFHTPADIPQDVLGFWRERQRVQDRFMALTAGPEWFRMMALSREGSGVAAIRSREPASLVAVLPLLPMIWSLNLGVAGRCWYRRNLSVLRVCGGDLIEKDVDPRDLTALWRNVTERYPAVQGLWFDHVGSETRGDKIRRSADGASGFLVQSVFRGLPHYRLKLPPAAEEIRRRRSRESLKKIQGRERALSRAAGAECRLVEIRRPLDWEPYVGKIMDLMSHTWQSRRLGHRFDASSLRDVAQAGWLRSFLLLAGESAAAFAFCFQGEGVLVYEQIGYDPAFAKYSPGTILLYRLLDRLYETDTPECVDFGEGEAEYKSLLADEVTSVDGLMVLRRSYGMALLLALHGLGTTLSHGGRAFVRSLAARKRSAGRDA